MTWLAPAITMTPQRASPDVLNARGRFAAVAFMLQVAVIGTGCTYNGSPIHSLLRPDELKSRVEARWTLGMSAAEATRVAQSAGLKLYAMNSEPRNEIPEGSSQYWASVRRPGFRVVPFVPGADPDDLCTLQFYFDDKSGLNRITFRRPVEHDHAWVNESRTIIERQEPTP